jgi:hypothetical protein
MSLFLFTVCISTSWGGFRFSAPQECASMGEAPLPYHPNTPFPFCRPTSTHKPCFWHSSCATLPFQGVQAKCGAEHHCWHCQLPQCWQEQSDQHAQMDQGALYLREKLPLMSGRKGSAMAAQPGHIKDLQSVQLECGLWIVDLPGVIFDNNESI